MVSSQTCPPAVSHPFPEGSIKASPWVLSCRGSIPSRPPQCCGGWGGQPGQVLTGLCPSSSELSCGLCSLPAGSALDAGAPCVPGCLGVHGAGVVPLLGLQSSSLCAGAAAGRTGRGEEREDEELLQWSLGVLLIFWALTRADSPHRCLWGQGQLWCPWAFCPCGFLGASPGPWGCESKSPVL